MICIGSILIALKVWLVVDMIQWQQARIIYHNAGWVDFDVLSGIREYPLCLIRFNQSTPTLSKVAFSLVFFPD